ncbi:exodeoxyribonuclease V subunit gamma [Bacterioplanoides sp. SCSIO 12839]|uniref:exodeoxyribonuclease V subunit gamma n=1 Tax=Bacterioplanoides sp. SCSIO 12839 TaxID=2829569 RepID=UPI002106DDFA|nr:exodeoxyribonuclease V subunit gamma [Bacterioplanoides sp. SCSIO 12839]UTW46855.1 exodeoxyribonuclease V subunit gamma [Bacterioplanoides sp. SCSIO 12839]
MFHLYHSNDLDVLRGILVNRMADNPPSPFEQEAILVQSQGMAHWLKLQLADGLGIAAQIDFPLPSSFVWKVFNSLKPELPERSHFEKQAMAWKLMRLLPQLVDDEPYQAIAHYLKNDDNGLRCYQLAHKIADVFDQYLVYRPDWLLAWEAGDDDILDSDVSRHPWQPHLWRALVKDSAACGHSLDHRARLAQQLESLVAQHPERLQDLPKRLFVFGIAALPGSYWDVLRAISPVIDVHFFLLNPCKNFWGDIVDDKRRLQILKKQPDAIDYFDRGNPLLASWGKLGREFLTLVHEADIADIEAWVDDSENKNDNASTNTSTNLKPLLKHLQQAILELQDQQCQAFSAAALEHSEFKTVIARDDDSIRFVAAHSPLREVQQLHDQLLSWFDADANLKPRDVVVMVPDIDQYAPYIDAVFSSVADHTRIPWAIADQSMSQENPLLEGWLNLLGLADSRLLVTDIQDWLDISALRHRFAINEDELDTIKDWLQRAEIRWGLNAKHRQQLGLPEFEQNSWQKGLRQLLLGLMLPDDAGQWQGDYGVAAVEGNAGELLGKLMALLDQLEYWQTLLSQQHTVNDWQVLLLRLIDDFFEPDVTNPHDLKSGLADNASLQKIRDVIQRWQEGLEDSGYQQTLSPAVVKSWFVEQLGQQGGWQRFLAGPVNFCTLMPMRSIPFKAVCMLGMNDEDYPRRVTPVGFDLMVSGNSRRGDRSRRDDDRYLFLEALCSAQQHLYISYRGRDSRENTELQPSVLVSELQDYIVDSFVLPGDGSLPHKQSRKKLQQHLIKALPLQPFNANEFNSYQKLWAQVANATETPESLTDFLQQPLDIPDDIDTSEVNWQDVKDALAHPARFFIQRRLKSSLDMYWQQEQTEEPFAPNGLELYQLRQQWMSAYEQQGDEPSDFLLRQQSLGKLPVNQLGSVWSEDIQDELSPLAQTLVVQCQHPVVATTLQYELSTPENENQRRCHIIAELQQAYHQSDQKSDLGSADHQFIMYRTGAIRGEHLWRVWLDLLMVSAAKPDFIQQAIVYGINKKDKKSDENGLVKYRLVAPSASLAKKRIEQLMSLYWRCWQQPQPFIAGLLWDSLLLPQHQEGQAQDDSETWQEAWDAWQKLIQKMLNTDFSVFSDSYWLRCMPDMASQFQDETFVKQWLSDFQPFVRDIEQHLMTDENDYECGSNS